MSDDAPVATPGAEAIGLDAAELDVVFPFHFAIDPDGRIARVGPSLRRLCPGLEPGRPVELSLELHRPSGPVRYELLAAEAPSFIVLRLRDQNILLRGQTLLARGRVLFLGTPWITELGALGCFGLTIADFAPHDPLVDFLTLLQTKNIALSEASAMAESLERTRHHLEGLLADNLRIRSRLETLVSNLPWGVLVEDDVGRVALANEHFCAMFGVPVGPAALVGAVCADMAVAAREQFRVPEAFDESTRDRLRERRLHLGETFELVDGRVLERDYVPVEDATGYRGHLWQYRDVTAARQAANELSEARRRAETANVAKDEFLAMMSHEMRTPLGVIIGLAELLQGELSSRARRDFVQRLDVNARSLMKLIEDTLDLARLEVSEVRLELAPFDPWALVDEVATGLGSSASGKGLELVVLVDPSVPASVIGDEHRLRQVLVNLASNAIKFTDTGEVRILLRADPIDADRVALECTIEDTGRGIPQAMHEAVFERFVRVEHAGETPGQGTGLGLPICRKLVSAMGGTLTLRSTLGSGSSFRVTVPLALAAAQAHLAPPLTGVGVAIISARPSVRRSLELVATSLGATLVPPDQALTTPRSRATARPLVLVDGALDAASSADLLAQLDPRHTLSLLAPGEVPSESGFDVVARPVSRASLMQALGRMAGGPGRRVRAATLNPDPIEIRPAHVLLAEDDPDAREVIVHLLGRLGHDVDTASDGSIAYEKVRAGAYDVLLTDLRMPGLPGTELIRKIRALEATTGRPRLPIVAVSADALSDRRLAALEAGADDFVSKPLRGEVLAGLVARLADRRPLVLIVDDARDMRMLTRHHLEAHGHWRVLEAGTGRGALELLAKRSIDLLLLDLGLPDGDGLTLLPEVRALGPAGALPIIIMSGRSDEATRARCREAGCPELLVKPVERAHLLRVVERCLDRANGAVEPFTEGR